MLKIRLSRTGKKAQPSFRIVLQEHTNAAKGKFNEILGHYRPSKEHRLLEVNEDRIKYWISVGAKPSDRVGTLLKGRGFDKMDQYIGPRNKKRKKKKEVEEKPAPAPTPAPTPDEPKAEESVKSE